jgi:hypothetical protein
LKLTNTKGPDARNLMEKLQKGTKQMKVIITEKTKERCKKKIWHKEFPHSLDEILVDDEGSI